MFSDLWEWVIATSLSSGVLLAIAYFTRDIIARFITRSIEHRFDGKLESFKSEVRSNEEELGQIRAYLTSSAKDRQILIQSKRLEAAEVLFRAKNALSQLTMLVEYMKILNIDEVLKDSADPKIAEFVEVLTKPFEVDEKLKQLGSVDKALPRLYLSKETLDVFDAYESIILQAAMMMKFLMVPLRDKSRLIKRGSLSKKVIELVPPSKEGFEKFGEDYVYQWANYFYDQVLVNLRKEVSGDDDVKKFADSAGRMAIESRRAQLNVQQSIQSLGLSGKLVKVSADDASLQ